VQKGSYINPRTGQDSRALRRPHVGIEEEEQQQQQQEEEEEEEEED